MAMAAQKNRVTGTGSALADRCVSQSMLVLSSISAALHGEGDLDRAMAGLFGVLPLAQIRLYRLQDGPGAPRRICHLAARRTLPSGAPLDPALHSLDDAVDLEVGVADHRTGHGGARVLIARARTTTGMDVLDLTLKPRAGETSTAVADLLAAAIADAWARRTPGLIATRLDRQRRSGAGARRMRPILDPTNPYALTQAEFRVCALLGCGLSAKAIARELGLSESTIRTHQRYNYAKTECRGQLDVLVRLRSDALVPARPAASRVHH